MTDLTTSAPLPAAFRDDGERFPLSWPAIGVLAALFVVLAAFAGTIGTLPGDLWVTTHLQRLHGQPWRTLWHLGDAFGTSGWVVWIALAGLVATAAMRWWNDVVLLGAVLLLRAAAFPIKSIVQSPRPASAQAHLVEHADGFGFPSGHTLTAMALFGTIAVLMVRHMSWPHARYPAGSIWILGVGTTGFARIWSGAHWTSDVVGSVLLGTVMIAVAAKVQVLATHGLRIGIADTPWEVRL
ncbi:MAG: phosphatase PAP2 family protein [Thermomicrobiales bacterium]